MSRRFGAKGRGAVLLRFLSRLRLSKLRRPDAGAYRGPEGGINEFTANVA